MPIKRGYSKASISHNIRVERKAGRSPKQSIAIALNVARAAAHAAGKPHKAPRSR